MPVYYYPLLHPHPQFTAESLSQHLKGGELGCHCIIFVTCVSVFLFPLHYSPNLQYSEVGEQGTIFIFWLKETILAQ